MAVLRNEDVKWYVCTRKDTGAHSVRNEVHVEIYEREYERLREFDTLKEAQEAYAIRVAADEKTSGPRQDVSIKAAKIRGDIKEGSKEDEELRAKIKAEIEEEQKAQKPPSSRGAKMGPKTSGKTKTTKPTKAPLE